MTKRGIPYFVRHFLSLLPILSALRSTLRIVWVNLPSSRQPVIQQIHFYDAQLIIHSQLRCIKHLFIQSRVLLIKAFGLCYDLLQPQSEEHTSELQSRENLVCRLLLEKKN